MPVLDDSLARHFTCPITGELLRNPVLTCDGFLFEHAAITEWLNKSNLSPLTGKPLESKRIIPVRALKQFLSHAPKRERKPETITRLRLLGDQFREREEVLVHGLEDTFTLPAPANIGELRRSLPCGENVCVFTERWVEAPDNASVLHAEYHVLRRGVDEGVVVQLEDESGEAREYFVRAFTPDVILASLQPLHPHVRALCPYIPSYTTFTFLRAGVASGGDMQIFVRMLTGRLLTLDVDLSFTVQHVKALIYREDGLFSDQQRLIWAGRQLSDESTLAECGIARESTLHVVLRLAGGCVAEEVDPAVYGFTADALAGGTPQDIVQCLAADPHPNITMLRVPSGVGARLREKISTTKQQVPRREVQEALGEEVWNLLMSHGPFDRCYLRRATEGALRWHVDTASLRTLQLALNEDYEGGELVFAAQDGFRVRPRGVSVTVHDRNTAHSVRTIRHGARDSLFLCDRVGLTQLARDVEREFAWWREPDLEGVCQRCESLRTFSVENKPPTTDALLDLARRALHEEQAQPAWRDVLDYLEWIESSVPEPPTARTDLVWHTHMQNVVAYPRACVLLTGQVRHHRVICRENFFGRQA